MSGATSATFHPDGSVASVVFAPAAVERVPAPYEAKPTPDVEEALARPFKTDVEALELPSYEDEVRN